MSSPATTSPPPSPPPSTAADDHSPPPQPSPIDEETNSPEVDHTQSQSQSQSQSPKSQSNSPPQPPPPTIPLIELQSLSSALSTVQDSFDSFYLHLNTLKTAVDNLIANNPSKNSKVSILPQSRSNFYQQTGVSGPIGDDPCDDIVGIVSIEGVEANIEGSEQELKALCESMDFRGLKRHLVMNIRDIDALRLEVPKALKLAPNPAKLVLECSGRFFLQGSKAYVKGSPMVTGREASVLILECFILMEGGDNECQIDAEVKEEADRAVSLWRKRMISEGGIMQAWRIDARGLLLLLGGFGVPLTFKNDDLRDLLRNSNVREMAGTLRRSNALMTKVPEIIEEMIKNKLEVDAIDVAYTFGLEERFDFQTILTSMLQKFEEHSNKGKKSSQASSAVNETNKKQLVVLKSLAKCLEGHKIDSSKIIPGWKVEENISSLEKDINEYHKNIGAVRAQKRRSEEAVARRRAKFHEGKRARHTGQWAQQQRVGHSSQRHLVDSGHINGYSASQSMLHAHGPETGYAAPGAYGGMVVDQSGRVINHGVQPYGWHSDPNLTERAVTHTYAAPPSASTVSHLYGPPSSSLEGYVMVPSGSSIAVPNRGTASDLYQFADTVVENEYHPPTVPSNPTSYPY